MILHAQLEIWKAAYSEEDLGMQWLPETASSNASSGDVSDGKFYYYSIEDVANDSYFIDQMIKVLPENTSLQDTGQIYLKISNWPCWSRCLTKP